MCGGGGVWRGVRLKALCSFVFLYFVCLLCLVDLVLNSADEKETEGTKQHYARRPPTAVAPPEVPSPLLGVVVLVWVHSHVNVIKHLFKRGKPGLVEKRSTVFLYVLHRLTAENSIHSIITKTTQKTELNSASACKMPVYGLSQVSEAKYFPQFAHLVYNWI